MPLEAVMVCLDNSDYMRNGDYTPSRFDSQSDAANLLCGAKLNQNPENCAGILCSAGDRVEVMITPCADLGRLVTELAKVKVNGQSDLLRAIQTAQFALKHRQNKKQKQRIIAFVGSPINASDKELETLGKNLKKNSVALDLVSFGEVEENAPKLEKLMNALNSSDTSHLLEAPVGPKLLSDLLLSSPIINPDGQAGGGGGGDAGFGFGIDPNDDPELALALRISMEEERARQQAMDGGAAGGEASAGAALAAEGTPAPASDPAGAAFAHAAPASAAPAPAAPVAADADVMAAMAGLEGMDDMDEELRQALLLSMQETQPAPASAPAAPPAAEAPKAAEAAAPQEAPAASQDVEMRDAAPAPSAPAASSSAPAAAGTAATPAAAAAEGDAGLDAKWFQDPSFVQELLGSLPGVDINDPRIQSALNEVSGDGKDKASAKDEDKTKKDGR
eukprot:TRINITY_DN597_c0_g1_i1.p1 TRINITY_DN597_c0_g1~~TRINITY_DN597_c0_g1_i1.p1  ORF type:complete len:473 (+),score=149.78 TRINITY_DN597_c0_g1_i1:76-1419(+)